MCDMALYPSKKALGTTGRSLESLDSGKMCHFGIGAKVWVVHRMCDGFSVNKKVKAVKNSLVNLPEILSGVWSFVEKKS